MSEPVRHIVPPRVLEVLPSGLSILIPLLLMHVILDMIPLLPVQYIAPPSSPAILLVNMELYNLTSSPLTYSAAPSLLTLLPSKVEWLMVVVPSAYIAAPVVAELLINLDPEMIEVEVIEFVEAMYIAPPLPEAELLMKQELIISTLSLEVHLSAAPSVPLALTKLMFFNTTWEFPLILKMDAWFAPSIVYPAPSIVMSLSIAIPLDTILSSLV
jgi:hypothetical protein